MKGTLVDWSSLRSFLSRSWAFLDCSVEMALAVLTPLARLNEDKSCRGALLALTGSSPPAAQQPPMASETRAVR